ncbi:MAG: alanine--tRNA ligase [Acidobacteria bacterium]|nr:MAG: alanine--tRNA ligase [Acidobacteriota bacterium]
MLTGHQIRGTFLDFFAQNGHRVVRSSPLVPIGDPTLLFTNAGMNQFKDVFLGIEQRDYKRAASAQKCVRAGGKHNDLENVGFTNRHHTFFEMLGNFSFGDYFKKDAVAFAWELVTSSAAGRFGIPLDKLYFTVFGGAEIAPGKKLPPDEEAAEHWIHVGAPKPRVIAIPGLKENFWAMGDTGPCGPCSEIHYDMGLAASAAGHTNCEFGCDCGRYVEIWNLVFMQFNRDATGNVAALPKPSIDTGAGLERLAAVLQGKISNFETDLFRPLMDFASKLSGKQYFAAPETDASLRILADHSRAAAFLIADGVMPSNEGRGYVLRKIIRRAVRHGRMLGLERPFLFEMAHQVAEEMREPYPELLESIGRVTGVIRHEEERFAHTIDMGLRRLEEDLTPLLTQKKSKALVSYPGDKAFRLYDTFGLPLDFIQDTLRDQGIGLDQAGFDHAMQEQRERAKASWKGAHKEVASPAYAKLAETFRTEPDFYYGTSARDCRIEAIITPKGPTNELPAGAEGEIVLDRTPFYAESGGQIADTGTLWNNERTLEVAEVRGAYYPVTGLVAHRVKAKETLLVGDRVAGEADTTRRERNKRNHTATHLMHAALRNILGTHVKQAGSLVAPDRLRFDFSHFAPVDPAELTDIEQQVNDHIRQNAAIETDITTLDDALASGALAFFGDRYPEQNVRVVTIPDHGSPRGFYSKELCGGTHVKRAGDIGVFKIAVEQSVASGIRRIEALTGEGALADYQRSKELLAEVAARLHVGENEVNEALERLAQAQKQAEKQLEAAQRKAAVGKLDTLLQGVRSVRDVAVLSAQVEGLNREGLRELVDPLRQKMGSGVFVLAAIEDGRVALLSSVTRDLTDRLHAGKIIQSIAKDLGGQGGGRPDLAEAGGKDTSNLKSALERVYAVVEGMLSSR